MPHSSRTLPSRGHGRWTALAVVVSTLPWFGWVGWFWFGPAATARGVAHDPVQVFWLCTGVTVVAWSVLACLPTPRLPLTERVKVACAGVAATLVWFPALAVT